MIYKTKNGALPRTPALTTGDGCASWSLPPAALDQARLGWPLPTGLRPQKRLRAASGAQAPDGDTIKSQPALNSRTKTPKGIL
jgi:hypothetical protein